MLGRPIEHSLSPVLHNAAYTALGLPWQYQAQDCGVVDLSGVLAERADWAGFSLTMPLKRAALEQAVQASSRARAVGAANTLLPVDGGGWRADNTDVQGVLGALAEASCRPSTATLLGAGGTAQAALVALAELGLRECAVLVRDTGRTVDLQATAAAAGVTLRLGELTVAAPELGAGLVVSTLPAGAADGLAVAPWRSDQTLLDVVYAPWPTALAAAVSASGGAVLSGALMLLHQAMAQVELMTGRAAPAAAMRAALAAAAPDAGL
ncbi:MAG: aroE [Jatrophihabitans sp.]|nr:aroE [Jatrophihabitans sp.]